MIEEKKIILSELKKSDKGRMVIYRSRGGDKIERGKISSWNDRFIFVNYEDCPESCPDFFNPTAAATLPEDLEWYDNGRRLVGWWDQMWDLHKTYFPQVGYIGKFKLPWRWLQERIHLYKIGGCRRTGCHRWGDWHEDGLWGKDKVPMYQRICCRCGALWISVNPKEAEEEEW